MPQRIQQRRTCPACDGTIRNPIRRLWFHAMFLLELANPPSNHQETP